MHAKSYLFLLVALVSWLVPVNAVAKPEMPNILLVVIDDLGYGDSKAWFPESDKSTPTINDLAEQGIKFTRFYTDSTCSTSRAALLTGMHPVRLGFHPVARGIPTELTTLPEYLQLQGYRTALIGKWHIGELYSQAKPNAQGFDYFFGYLNQWFLQGVSEDGVLRLKPPISYDPWLTENTKPLQQFKGYLPEILTQQAEIWLAQQRDDQPWFLMYSTPLPHAPFIAPPNMEQTEDKEAIYRAMVERVDSDLARLVAVLEKNSQLENTLLIVLSDNGAPNYLSGSNAGFLGGKWAYTEGALRVPMLWRLPKHFLPPKIPDVTEKVFIADIYPSLIGYLTFWRDGLGESAPFDGRDIFGDSEPEVLQWLTRTGYSVLRGNERYSGNWLFQQLYERTVETVTNTSSVIKETNEARAKVFEPSLQAWLDDVTKVALVQSPQGVYKGNDFLRTPLINWDFYLAVVPVVDEKNKHQKQWLAGQDDSWQITWDGRELDLQMHGGRWQVRLPADGKCHFIGIHADLYDRYTNMIPTLNLSRIMLTIDGFDRLDGKWEIEDLSGVDITPPLYVGRVPSEKNFIEWSGKVSEPYLFHRGNRLGNWAFKLDEKKMRNELCGSLMK